MAGVGGEEPVDPVIAVPIAVQFFELKVVKSSEICRSNFLKLYRIDCVPPQIYIDREFFSFCGYIVGKKGENKK